MYQILFAAERESFLFNHTFSSILNTHAWHYYSEMQFKRELHVIREKTRSAIRYKKVTKLFLNSNFTILFMYLLKSSRRLNIYTLFALLYI